MKQLLLFTTLAIILSLTLLPTSESKTTSLSTVVPAGTEYCFFEFSQENQPVKVSFQVFAGGALDINFRWNTADGQEIISDNRKINQGKYAWNALYTGVSQICFSNTFSTVSDKSIFFEVIVGVPTEQWEKPVDTTGVPTSETALVDSVRNSLQNAHNQLAEITRLQSHLRFREARHMFTAEDNNNRVMYFSILECAVLVITACVQVYFVRQFFKNEKRGSI